MTDEYLAYDDLAERLDNQHVMRIVQVRTEGLRTFYTTQDCRDGHTTVLGHNQVRLYTPKCETCHIAIPKERLRAMPFTRTCVKHTITKSDRFKDVGRSGTYREPGRRPRERD